MSKAIALAVLAIFLSGCATYKFQTGKKPYDKGYVASRDDYVIPEYTLGKDNSVPDLELAKKRFKQRKGIVEYYYKKMGYIENRFKMAFWDPVTLFIKMIGGVIRLPFVAIADYKYGHNPKYREIILKREQKQDAKEEARIRGLKERLNIYLKKELSREGP